MEDALAENMRGMSLGGTAVMVNKTTRSVIGSSNGMMGPSPVRRNKSGPHGHRMMMMSRARAPPKRTQSQTIGRPAFDPVLLSDASAAAAAAVDQQNLDKRQQQPKRGVNRSQSSRGKTTAARNVPSRSGSFQRGVNRSQSNRVKTTTARNVPPRSGSFHRGVVRRVPDRTCSTSSLRRRVPDRTGSTSSLRRGSAKRQQLQHTASTAIDVLTTGSVQPDDVSVSDSVYTSISIQTMDSIMVRKKQILPTQGKDGGGSRIEFEEDVYYDDDGDMVYEYEDELSVFSESWCSSDDESAHSVISDYYEEEEMDGAILEEESSTTFTNIETDKGTKTGNANNTFVVKLK